MLIRNLVGLILLAAAALAYASPADATCTVPNQLTNGQIADATAVMGNFNALANCAGAGVDQTAWTTYTPSVTAGIGAFTSVSATGRYKQIGKTVFVQIKITIATNGTASYFTDVSLPVPTVNVTGNFQVIMGVETFSTGITVRGALLNGSTICRIQKYDGTYIGADGYVLNLSGSYEAA
jgi:hypothetical protein